MFLIALFSKCNFSFCICLERGWIKCHCYFLQSQNQTLHRFWNDSPNVQSVWCYQPWLAQKSRCMLLYRPHPLKNIFSFYISLCLRSLSRASCLVFIDARFLTE